MLIIYGVPVSVHTRKVIVAALEKGVEYRNEPVIPFSPPANWGELSPTGKIPVATDGDLLLRDSSAICGYLERAHPEPPLYPLDAGAYAQSLFLEEYADGTVFPELVRPLFHQKIIRPQMLGQSTDASVVDQVLGEVLPRVFGFLELELDRECAVGTQFGVADIALVSNLLNFHYLGFAIEPRYGRLGQYFRRHLHRASLQKALAGELQAARSLQLDTRSIAA